MKSFTDDIIKYITNNFANDESIGKKVKVDYAYNSDVSLKPPYIFVQAINDSDAEQFDTFDGVEMTYVPVQITAYCQQMKIDGVDYTANEVALIFAEKIKSMFSKVKAISWNNNIRLMRRVGSTPSMPLKNGATTYFSPIRYDFYINNPYREIQKGE